MAQRCSVALHPSCWVNTETLPPNPKRKIRNSCCADFTHWSAYGISAAGGSGLAPDGQFPTGTKYGTNSAGKTGWIPPCPPEGDDAHHYNFSMYALKDATGLPDGASPDEVLAKLDGAVAKGSFTGTYKRAG